MVFLSLVHHVRGDVDLTDLRTLIVVIDKCFHRHQIDQSLEAVFLSDRKLERNSVRGKTVLHHVDGIIEIRAHDVHLVDESHTGNTELIRLTPYRFGLRLYAAFCVKDRNGSVQNTKRTLHLDGEINVSGSIDDIDTMSLPIARSSGRSDGDTALLLLDHPVHLRVSVLGIAHLVDLARIEQNSLGQSGLTRINVGHDTNISGILQRVFSCHFLSPHYITCGNAQTPCWPLPSYAYLLSSLLHFRCCWLHP